MNLMLQYKWLWFLRAVTVPILAPKNWFLILKLNKISIFKLKNGFKIDFFYSKIYFFNSNNIQIFQIPTEWNKCQYSGLGDPSKRPSTPIALSCGWYDSTRKCCIGVFEAAAYELAWSEEKNIGRWTNGV